MGGQSCRRSFHRPRIRHRDIVRTGKGPCALARAATVHKLTPVWLMRACYGAQTIKFPKEQPSIMKTGRFPCDPLRS
jgi:hypothetical protein